MTAATSAQVEPPDTTDATMALLRELRSGRVRQQASNVVFWLYVAGLFVLVYGGWAVAAAAHALQHPPPPLPVTPQLERAAPAALCALALLFLAAQLWDARWRGPVTIALPTADWLLSTLVRRDRLLRPRYRASALAALGAGAAAGLVPVAALLAAGLGGNSAGHALRLAIASMLSTALLAGCGTGLAGLAEAGDGLVATGAGGLEGAGRLSPAGRLAWAGRLARRGAAIRLTMLAALALAGLAAASAAFRLPAVIGSVLLWSGPWGWAAQAPVALAARTAPLWPVALGLLALAAGALLIAGDRVAPRVPAAVLRARARTMGNMSAAALNLDGRRVTIAYRDAGGSAGRVRITLPAPRRRELVLVWRDLLALLRAPSRLAWSLLLALTAVGLAALAVRDPRDSVLPLALALIAGYLAAAGLCDAARLDADDPRRSGGLPFRFQSLPWRHAVVPWLALTLFAGLPSAALAIETSHPLLLALVPAATAALTGGALVNSFRGQLEGEMYGGFETPMGHSSGVTITLWYLTGPLLAVAPMIVIGRAALLSRTAGGVATAAVFGVALAGWLGYIASNRAARLSR